MAVLVSVAASNALSLRTRSMPRHEQHAARMMRHVDTPDTSPLTDEVRTCTETGESLSDRRRSTSITARLMSAMAALPLSPLSADSVLRWVTPCVASLEAPFAAARWWVSRSRGRSTFLRDGVVEDVADIALNLKEVRVKHTEEPVTLHFSSDKVGLVKAGDLATNPSVEILNVDHPIATISEGGKLEMTSLSRTVRVTSLLSRTSEEWPVGMIALDADFRRHKVNYRVTNARVGQRTDYDKLTFEVWTNGSVGAP